MTQEKIKVKREDLYKSWGYDTEKLPFGVHMWLEPEKSTRQNPYHDHIELGSGGDLKQARTAYEIFRTGKDWFIENNIEAYMDLID